MIAEGGGTILVEYYSGSVYKALQAIYPGKYASKFTSMQSINGRKSGFLIFQLILSDIGKTQTIKGHF